ncbi:MAG: hypothetical protein E7311_07045 [Clostridiales bacterium]|nr:hypothetical protein [Clostridiales bacterium]
MEDMSNMINKLSDMLNSSDAPNDIKEMINTFTQNSDSSNNTATISSEDTNNTNNNINIDIDMILKAKKIMEAMSNTNDPRKDLLLSLKPYVKNSKKEKIDKYIKFLNISKAFEIIGPEILGSDKNV